MKIIAFILAVTILVLSSIPCKDEAFVKNGDEAKVELSAPLENQDQDHSDVCSPFCPCSCCSAFANTHLIIVDAGWIPECSNNYSSLYIGSVVEISLPIWQPPQLLV
jgi:hypothetical protein